MFLGIRLRWTWKVVKPLMILLSIITVLKIAQFLQPIECESLQRADIWTTSSAVVSTLDKEGRRQLFDSCKDCYIANLDPECFHAASFNIYKGRNSSRRSTFVGQHKIKETALQMKEILTKLKQQATVLSHTKELNLLENRTDYLLSLFEEPGEEDTPKLEAAKNRQPRLVCPETYLGSTKGYPFFYTGFAISNCTVAKPFNQVLSILINHIELPIDLSTLFDLISSSYPNITISIATTQEEHTRLNSRSINPQVHLFKEGTSPVKAWNFLFANATTPYVLVARNMISFSWDARLERLVREAVDQNVDFAGGAIRNLSGNWNLGCYQTKNRNYSLEYIPGYYYSLHECLYCSYLAGPFVARTEAIQYLRLRYDISEKLAFEDLFYRFTHNHGSHSLLCPDSMFYVKDSFSTYSGVEVWKEFSQKYRINRVRLPSGKVLDLCSTSNCNYLSGSSLPRCCMQDLSFVIKTLMKSCEELGMMCELQEGTLLGAVKLGGVLPWERDADITFHTQNFTSLEKLRLLLEPHGMSLKTSAVPWCCVDGVEAGGIAIIHGHHWHIEMYGQHLMDSEKLGNNGLPPTRLHLDGQWVSVPHNPGLYVRNRYGSEIYRHSVHWMTHRMRSGWEKYDTKSFPSCGDPGHHSCLDQYSTDGNIQFRDEQ